MKKNKTYQLYIFDFDGTIADTEKSVTAAMKAALSECGFMDIPEEKINEAAGVSLKQTFKQLLGNEYSDDLSLKLASLFDKKYYAYSPLFNKLYPDIIETIQFLRGRGSQIAVATSKKTEQAKHNLTNMEIASYFDLIVGFDMVSKKKPDPQMLNYILSSFSMTPMQSLMIGDSLLDIEMGRNIKMDTALVLWNENVDSKNRNVQPTYYLRKPTELRKFAQKELS